MSAYYNENDPKAAAWLRELIKQDHIAPGEVDERSIEDVRPSELEGFTQCHFFAGIGVWSYALRRAGWPDDQQIWTGSCPCQPFSSAGKKAGFADERHLWPAWFHLIRQRKPPVIIGEQVSAKSALPWLDLVQTDLEGEDYAFGAFDTCAAGVGAPHIRQRIYFVAESQSQFDGSGDFGTPGGIESTDGSSQSQLANTGCQQHRGWRGLRRAEEESGARKEVWLRSSIDAADGGSGCRVGNSSSERIRAQRSGEDAEAQTGLQGKTQQRKRIRSVIGDASSCTGVAQGDTCCQGLPERECHCRVQREAVGTQAGEASECRSHTNGFWRDVIWLPCRDGKARPVKPGIEPLVDGAPARVGRLRGYGNAIVSEVAKEVIRSYMEICGGVE